MGDIGSAGVPRLGYFEKAYTAGAYFSSSSSFWMTRNKEAEVETDMLTMWGNRLKDQR